MKIKIENSVAGFVAPRRGERGIATVIFIGLLAILVILVTAETQALIRLHREVKLLEQQQIKRWNGSQTNAVPATIHLQQ